ncbi:DUF488 domain-containing protein [Streptomyces bauhiniae]|uniref:DUF488 family protein, N3 subclade n=1 Tax=Streptomyces TaxID=1883 RepID=UPI00136FC1A4|nr:DUF488 family protein [Streptomyces sp. SID2999]
MSVRVRRVYEPPEPDDGLRVLVDRLWPRGISKEEARLDEWPKALTPSDDLRRWYHHGGPYDEFRHRYEEELTAPEAAGALGTLRELVSRGPVTLLTAGRDPEHSQASVLRDLLAS